MNIEELNPYNCTPLAFIAANEDLFNGDPTTDVLSMKKYNDIMFLISKGTGATGTAVITVESCDDVVPTSTTTVVFRYRVATSGNTWGAWQTAAVTGFTTTAGADQMYQIHIRAQQLNGSDAFVRMVATESVDSPVDGDITCMAANPRYAYDGAEDLTS